jgi:phospholipase C
MLGFLQDYYRNYMTTYKGLDILWMFTPDLLPNLHNAAWAGAVSDMWFCSVPTQTNPNRAYSLCGTSLGRENNGPFAVEQFDVPTLFNAMSRARKSWGLYYHDIWKNGQNFTQYTFPRLNDVTSGNEIAHIERFFDRARGGSLPEFVYLEPAWSYGIGGVYKQGNDFHPPASVQDGDQFVGRVFNALRSSPQWSQTLFIITFDEHGGTYDHYPTPWGAVNPDGLRGSSGFDFNRFGVRVPTILISPWVRARGAFRAPAGSRYPFDHTSVIKTLLLWAGLDPNTAGFFKRMQAAPSFEGVFIRSDREASDNAAEIGTMEAVMPMAAATFEQAADVTAPLATTEISQVFEGIPAACVRAIFDTSNTPEEIHDKIESYKADPQKFEHCLEEGRIET